MLKRSSCLPHPHVIRNLTVPHYGSRVQGWPGYPAACRPSLKFSSLLKLSESRSLRKYPPPPNRSWSYYKIFFQNWLLVLKYMIWNSNVKQSKLDVQRSRFWDITKEIAEGEGDRVQCVTGLAETAEFLRSQNKKGTRLQSWIRQVLHPGGLDPGFEWREGTIQILLL